MKMKSQDRASNENRIEKQKVYILTVFCYKIYLLLN